MTYTKAGMRAANRYTKKHLKRVEVRFQKEEFESKIKPAADAAGLPVGTYIKQAVYEQIERDKI